MYSTQNTESVLLGRVRDAVAGVFSVEESTCSDIELGSNLETTTEGEENNMTAGRLMELLARKENTVADEFTALPSVPSMPRQTEYTVESSTEYETDSESSDIESSEFDIEAPVRKIRSKKSKKESDLMTALKTLIVICLIAVIGYIAMSHMGMLEEEELVETDQTTSTNNVADDAESKEAEDAEVEIERGTLRQLALKEKKIVGDELHKLEELAVGKMTESNVLGTVGAGLKKFAGDKAAAMEKFGGLLGMQDMIDQANEEAEENSREQSAWVIFFNNQLAKDILDQWFNNWSFKRMGARRFDPTDVVFEGTLRESLPENKKSLTKAEIITVISQAWDLEASATTSMLQHWDKEWGNWKHVQPTCASASLEVVWDVAQSSVSAATNQRGSDFENTVSSTGFLPNSMVNVWPASCTIDGSSRTTNPYKKSASFFYSNKDERQPFVQQIIDRLNMRVNNNNNRFTKNFTTNSAVYDQIHLFIEESKLNNDENTYKFRIHCRGHAKVEADETSTIRWVSPVDFHTGGRRADRRRGAFGKNRERRAVFRRAQPVRRVARARRVCVFRVFCASSTLLRQKRRF